MNSEWAPAPCRGLQTMIFSLINPEARTSATSASALRVVRLVPAMSLSNRRGVAEMPTMIGLRAISSEPRMNRCTIDSASAVALFCLCSMPRWASSMTSTNRDGSRRIVRSSTSHIVNARSSLSDTRWLDSRSFWVFRKYTLFGASSSPTKPVSSLQELVVANQVGGKLDLGAGLLVYVG